MREAIYKSPGFPALVQQFFTEYLVAQRALSPQTVACYRDAITLFLGFAAPHLRKAPTNMRLTDITPELILKFLAHLECERHNSVRSRNLRLTALRAFLRFAARRDVTALHTVERAMAVPMKRFDRPLLGHLTREEMIAVLGQPGSEWTSQRDHLLPTILYNTGARVSEIVGVRVDDVMLDGAACVHLHGKGRKERSVPIWNTTVTAVRSWLRANPQLRGPLPLLPNRSGHSMTRCNVTQRLALAVHRATADQPSLKNKRVSPHTLRGNVRAMEWAEVDFDAALWTIPARKMKRSVNDKANGDPHLVPLSRQAVAILADLQPLTGHGRYVFPSVRGGDRPMSDMTLNAALQRLGFDTKTDMTTHGFRAMARTMLAEQLDVPEAVIEAQLAHSVKDSLGRAYNRTTFVEQRRTLMQTWADYLDGLRSGNPDPKTAMQS